MQRQGLRRFTRPSNWVLMACQTMLLAAAAAFAPRCDAHVGFTPRLADPPNLAGTGATGFYPVDFSGTGQRTLVAVGDLMQYSSYDQTEVVTLGAPVGGVFQRSPSLLPRYATVERAVATSSYPQPLVLVAGYSLIGTQLLRGFDVYAGSPLMPAYSRPVYSYNDFSAAAFTRVANATDFDVALGSYNEIALWSANATAPTWTVATSSYGALALLPAYGPNPARLICAGGSQVELRDLSDGHVLWSAPISGGNKILVGNIAGDAAPEFVIVGADPGLVAFSSNPAAVLWQDTGSYVDADLYDRNGDGLLDIVYTDYDAHLGWISGNGGTPIGAPVSVPYRIDHIAVGNVGSATPNLVARTTPGPGTGLGIWPLSLAGERAHEQVETGPFDRFVVGDVDGSGRDKIAGLSFVPVDFGGTWLPTRLRIVDPANGKLVWSASFPTNVAPEDSAPYIDIDLTHLTPGGHPVLALLGQADLSGGSATIVYVDGVTHAVLKRQGFTLPEGRVATNLRMIDVDGDGVPEVVLVSEPVNSVQAGMMVHVLRADTLAVTWSSPILADEFPATWVAVRPATSDSAPRLLIGIPFLGLWSVNLGTHLVDYTATGNFSAASYLPSTSGTDRIAAFDTDSSSLRVFDAASGAELDSLPFVRSYRALAADPNDADRVLMVTDNHVVAVRLSDHAHEGMSRDLSNWLGGDGILRARAQGGVTTAYVGDGVGVWALTLDSNDALFSDGFESW